MAKRVNLQAPYRSNSAKSTAFTAASLETGYLYLCTGTFAVTLPDPSGVTDPLYWGFRNVSTGLITFSRNVNANSGYTLLPGQHIGVYYDGSGYIATAPQAFGAPLDSPLGTAIASATTVDLNQATGKVLHITGTTAITAFATAPAGIERTIIFDGSLTFTHDGTSLILPTGANITTAAGDVARMVSEGSGNWRCLSYTRADGTAVSSTGSGDVTSGSTITDNAVVRGDGGGKGVQESNILISDTDKLTIPDNATDGILNLTERATAPSTPVSGDIYLDDGSNTASGAPGFRRWNGAAWEDMGAVSGSGVADGGTLSTGLTFPNAGLHILDTNASHDLIVSPGSDLTADRTLTLTTGDADRTVTLGRDVDLSDGGTFADLPAEMQSLTFTFNNSTTASDPGAGVLRFDSATPASVTGIYIDDSPANISGLDLSAAYADLAGHRIWCVQKSDASKYLIGEITAVADGTGYYDLTVTTESSGSLPDNGAELLVSFIPGSAGSDVVDDTSPQLGGQLDVNGQAIGDGTRELITFTEDASAVNHVNIENEATGGGPIISAAGDDTNIDLNLVGKGTGDVKVGVYTFDGDQTVGAGQDNYVLTYDNGTGLVSLEAAAGGGGTTSMFIKASDFVPAATNGPSIGTLTDSDTNWDYLAYDGTTQEMAMWLGMLPNTWDAGTITIQYVWTGSSTATTGDGVVWESAAASRGDSDFVATSGGSYQQIDDDLLANSNTDVHITSATPAITVTGASASEPIIIKVEREVADAGDDMPEDALLFGIIVNFTNS